MYVLKRRGITGFLTLATIVALGACSSTATSGTDSTGASVAAPVTTEAATAGSATTGGSTTGPGHGGDGRRTVVDARGQTVEVPDTAERIVALTEPVVDGLTALGIEPIGVSAGRGQGTVANYMRPFVGEVPVVAALADPNVEQIAAIDPDLILVDGTSSSDPAVLEQLRKVAPTVWISRAGEDWQVAFTRLGEAVGRADDATDVLGEYEQRVAEVRACLAAAGRADDTVSIVRWGLTSPSLILKGLPAGRVITDLGLPRPPAQDEEGPGHGSPVSLERLSDIDADWMFFGTLGGALDPSTANDSTGSVGVQASVTALASAADDAPGFTNLQAYRSNRIIPIDGSAWTSAGGPVAAQIVVDDVANSMCN